VGARTHLRFQCTCDLRRPVESIECTCPRFTVRKRGCVHDALGNVEVGVSKSGCPGQVCGHLLQHIRKLGEPLDACIPRLLIGRLHQLLAFEAGVLLYPLIGRRDLVRECRRGENLRQQIVREKGNRRDELIELVGSGRSVGGRWRLECATGASFFLQPSICAIRRKLSNMESVCLQIRTETSLIVQRNVLSVASNPYRRIAIGARAS
jgi:hypothetical protein